MAADGQERLRDNFCRSAGKRRRRRKEKTKPTTIRFTDAERAELLKEAGRTSLSAHVRHRLFGEKSARRKGKRPAPRQNTPSTDQIALARLLAELGRSGLSKNLTKIAEAARMGAIPLTPELVDELEAVCADIRSMRALLIGALGIKVESRT